MKETRQCVPIGSGRAVDLFRIASKGIPRAEIEGQHARARGIVQRLYAGSPSCPGVILGDEVGKGKTYVALAVVLARLEANDRSKILILTHSQQMAELWQQRLHEVSRSTRVPRSVRSEIVWNTQDLEKCFSKDDSTQVAIGSFERLKRFGSIEQNVADLLYALRHVSLIHGRNLSEGSRRDLVDDFLIKRDGWGFDFRCRLPAPIISESNAHALVRECFDKTSKEWVKGKYEKIARYLHASAADGVVLERTIDLLIVDEAHKFEGDRRRLVISTLLRKRFKHCLYLTATPFALSWKQLLARIKDFQHAKAAGPAFDASLVDLERQLEQFAEAVHTEQPYPEKLALQRLLSLYLIRDTWDHARERDNFSWAGRGNPASLLPSILLERALYSLEKGDRTHITSRRESLCSSWAAARKSLIKNELNGVDGDWDRFFVRAVGSGDDDPKMKTAVKKLAALVRSGEKTVVFVNRIETSRALRRALEKELAFEIDEYRRSGIRWMRWSRYIGMITQTGPSLAKAVAKVVARSPDCPRSPRKRFPKLGFKRWWEAHRELLTREGEAGVSQWAGRGKHIDLMATFDGDSDPRQYSLEKFNCFPGAPFIFIATGKGQEGIDLHHQCKRVLLYDLCWNPASMEQRIGRVHRLGGIRRRGEKVEVIYCYQEGTYEEVMARRVRLRCEMMHVLLGAGQWLADDREKRDLKPYRLVFPASMPRP